MIIYSRSQQLILSALAALILFFGTFFLLPSGASSFQRFHSEPYQQWIIEVLGSVAHPGIYLFRQAPTLGEAIKKAGGNKNQFGVVPALESGKLPSGTTVYVTSFPSQLPILNPTEICKSFIVGLPMDINKASAANLSLVPGISDTLAYRIVLYRDRHGDFTTSKDLDRVKGLGPATIRRVANYLHLPAPLPHQSPFRLEPRAPTKQHASIKTAKRIDS